MSVTTRTIAASPDRVFDILRDGWSYASWVVGASCIRDVDADWPAVGSHLHHSVGIWPLLLNDSTEVEEMTPQRSLQLRARAWPSGEARVCLELEQRENRVVVTMTERIISGPARLIPSPLEEAYLDRRNAESLRRLAYLAERRDQP